VTRHQKQKSEKYQGYIARYGIVRYQSIGSYVWLKNNQKCDDEEEEDVNETPKEG
jgi:hypothetical protein